MGESFRLSRYGNQGGELSHEEKKTNAKISIFKRKKTTHRQETETEKIHIEKERKQTKQKEREKKI